MSETKLGRTFIAGVLAGATALTSAIAALMERTIPGKRAQAGPLLKASGLAPRIIAHFALRALMDALGPNEPVRLSFPIRRRTGMRCSTRCCGSEGQGRQERRCPAHGENLFQGRAGQLERVVDHRKDRRRLGLVITPRYGATLVQLFDDNGPLVWQEAVDLGTKDAAQ
jgi:hypothetical protein